jgi:hypothetical protein
MPFHQAFFALDRAFFADRRIPDAPAGVLP